MGMDIDYIFAHESLEKIEKLLGSIMHGERQNIADDIIKFETEMSKKYGTKDKKPT